MPAHAAPAAPVPVPTLASLYEVSDPEPAYVLPEPVAKPTPVAAPAVAPVAPAAAAAPVAAQPASAVAPAAPASRHPAWLSAQFDALGLNPLLSERLSTEDLTRVVLDTQAQKVAEADSRVRSGLLAATPNAAAQVAAVAAPNPAAQQQPAAFDWGTFDDVGIDGTVTKKVYSDADIDPALAHHIKSQDKRIAEMERFIKGMSQTVAQSHEARVEAEFDRAFEKFPAVFGTGPGGSLRGKPEFERRKAVYGAVKGMFLALPEAARASMTVESGVQAMAKSLFNAEPTGAAAAATPGTPTPEQFVAGAVAVPTQRRPSDQPFGRDRAVAETTEFMRETTAAGGVPSGGDTTLDEFF